MLDFRKNINRYVVGPSEAPRLREEIEKRKRLMKDLALKGYVDVTEPQEYDLVGAGIIHLEALCETKARYRPLEPLMLHALYRHLEKDQGCDFKHLLAEWMREIVGLLAQDWGDGTAGEQKGLATEVLLALILNLVAKEFGGRPLTAHPLFAGHAGTFLADYTLQAASFQHDVKGVLWADVLSRKRTDLLVIPPHAMGPDLFGLLSCLPDTESFRRFGPHFIPLTAGVKIRSPSTSLSAAYRANYLSTDPWAIFTRNGTVVRGSEEDRKKAETLLPNTFVGSKRALRISFTYRPLPSSSPGCYQLEDDQLHVKFDFHHPAFEDVLKKFSKEAAQHLKTFAKLQSGEHEQQL
jgi:hypothetical protein